MVEVSKRAREMLQDLIGCNFSDTTLRVATDWLKQERRLALADTKTETAMLREALEEYRAFAGEAAGVCLGVAMSTDHPNPDEPLMELFRKSQTLATKWRAALAGGKS